ncbi:hypothetical protein PVAP13_4KG116905 [Panicum virgatum]|uniref:Late embryogenesis abundant protein LEA-2 subgroup domain-containing protein n=1 Tax=Panicum virgatum TaxID=38727 RepID=A0A8T0TLF2_PANVG|nr:hypothetical protein PVAP13_4KG116905 [Panicum virgatum]
MTVGPTATSSLPPFLSQWRHQARAGPRQWRHQARAAFQEASSRAATAAAGALAQAPAGTQYLHHQHLPPPAGTQKLARYRQQQHRRGGGCSCRRACCLTVGFALLALCLALAAACLAYLYYRPRPPSFHLQPLAPVRLRLGNSSAAPALDATVGTRAVSWNPNERVAFQYGGGEGRAALADADGDVALGWAPVAGFDLAPRGVAAVSFVATARGVVVDEAVAARVRDRYWGRQQAFRVVVDTHVGVRVGALRTGMVPVRLVGHKREGRRRRSKRGR